MLRPDDETDQKPGVGTRWSGWLRRLVAVLLVIALLVAAITYRLFISPSTDAPESADAAVVFAGGRGERLDAALALVDAGVVDTIVANESTTRWDPGADALFELCDTGTDQFELICISVVPAETKAEGAAFAQIAAERGWEELIAVTGDFHLHRASSWLDRCFDGTVFRVSAPTAKTRRLIVREWGALVINTFLDRSCDRDIEVRVTSQ